MTLSPGLHFLSPCKPTAGYAGDALVPTYFCHKNTCKQSTNRRLSLRGTGYSMTRRTFHVYSRNSDGQRRNPDFPRQNKSGSSFSRGRSRSNQERDNPENLDDSEVLSSKNGPLLSTSNNSKFQATASPGPREKEIVELFRKVQAQLRERSANREEKKLEASKGQGEKGTVDSLLKLLRKHSIQQKKQRGGEFSLEQSDRENSFSEEPATNYDDPEVSIADEVRDARGPMSGRPPSNFTRRSPVPRVKFRPIFTTEEINDVTEDPSSVMQGNREKNLVESQPEPQLPVPEPFSPIVSTGDFDDITGSLLSEPEEDEVEELSELLPSEEVDLDNMKLPDLRNLAKSRGIKGLSKMKKADLREILRKNSV